MKKISLKNKKRFTFVLAILLISFLFLSQPVSAGETADAISGGLALAVSGILAMIAYFFISVIGLLMTGLIGVLVSVAQFNNIIGVQAVIDGWVIIRDLCNMFFILILLVIAFGTILRQENYSAKKMLPKVLIMAVLINFSKMFFGFIIDFSQVIMLTFVAAFAKGGGHFVAAFQVSDWFTLNDAKDTKEFAVTQWSTALAIVTGLVAAVISLIVVCVILAVLVVRIVMLWLYTILSPFVFLGWAFPPLQKYTSEIWESFIKQVMVGPVLAFFLWLSLRVASSDSTKIITGDNSLTGGASELCTGVTNIMCGGDMQKFIITIGLMMGGLMISQRVGGATGAIAGKGMDWAKKTVTKPSAWAGKKAKDIGIGTAKTTGKIGLAGLSVADRYLGKKIGFTKGEREKGLVGQTVSSFTSMPGLTKAKFDSFMDKNLDLNRARRDALDDENGELEYEGKKYRLNGKRYEEYKDGAFTGTTLKNAGGKEVGKMGAFRASAFDARNGVFSEGRAVANKAQQENVDKEKAKVMDSGMSVGEMRRSLENSATSQTKRMALAQTLAEKGGFKNNQQIELARKIVGSNALLSDKFNDEIDKKQAHLAYNFEGKKADGSTDTELAEREKDRFKRRVDDGKIDSTKLSSSAYEDKNVVSTLEDYHRKDFKRVMETAYKRGGKYEDAVAKGLLQAIDKDPVRIKDDAMAKLHAKLTGNINESFKDNSGNVNHEALATYIQSAKAADINKIDVEVIEDLSSSGSQDVQKALLQKMTYAKLKSMHRQGDNPELVRTWKEFIMANANNTEISSAGVRATRNKINNDDELSSV